MEDFNSNLVNAQKFRRMVIQQYCDTLREQDVDFVISPTGFGELPAKISDVVEANSSEKKSPVYEYKMDYFTVISNCLGTCNLTVPMFEAPDAAEKYLNFPSSIRCLGFFGEDYHMLRVGQRIEKILEINGMSPK